MGKRLASVRVLAMAAMGLSAGCSIPAKKVYVPEPKPVKSAIEITALYYPGTEQMAEWDQVEQTLPGIKPLLGWYDEGNPEVIDWQIKWAVEHGISSFCVDWYWNRGVQRLDHWVKGYYKARWRKHLKWYMMYANHNEPGAHSTEDQIRVTRFWIDHYFKTPEYYTCGGKPVVVYWDYNNLDRDFIDEAAKKGETLKPGEGVKRALAITEKLVKEAGLPGVTFIDMYHGWKYDPSKVDRAKAAGYEAQMIYNFDAISWFMAPESRKPEDRQNRFSYDTVMAAVPKWWEMTSRDPNFPLWPIIPTGWNDIPRSFQAARVIYGRTPEKFKKVCEECRRFCERKGFNRVVIAPLNEWQEGSYIEPNQEFGFGMYDALRDAFCEKPAEGWPKNLVPSDVGLGPYDYPPMPHLAQTGWDFSKDMQGWYRNPYGTAYMKTVDGAMRFFRSGGGIKPAIRTRVQPFEAAKFKTFTARMRVTPSVRVPAKGGERMKLLWGTENTPVFSKDFVLTDANTAALPIRPDGEWHTYSVSLADNPHWKDKVNEVWFDPVNLDAAYVDIKWLRFE
jgi:hypothetical protein